MTNEAEPKIKEVYPEKSNLLPKNNSSNNNNNENKDQKFRVWVGIVTWALIIKNSLLRIQFKEP